jgi:hypothetical protein
MCKISSILQYSTIDFIFLEANLKQLSKFSDEIIIPICDHFFNGDSENMELLEESYKIISKYPKCSTYMFNWEGHNLNTGYYHNLSRALGTSVAKNEWLLFVDADEIVDDGFKEWFKKIEHTNNMYWLTCYWYFREPIYQSKKTESAGLLIKKQFCNWNLDLRDERQQLFNNTLINGDYIPILSEEGNPIVHHFSWVRNKEDMLKKVKNWGHNSDKNWINLVEKEFSRPFNGTDFVHGYEYNIVENKFNL